jgi:hypothetical protein
MSDDPRHWVHNYDFTSDPPPAPDMDDFGPDADRAQAKTDLESLGRFCRNAYRLSDKHMAQLIVASLMQSIYARGGFSFNQAANIIVNVLVDGGGFHRSHNCFGELEPAPKDKEDDAG